MDRCELLKTHQQCDKIIISEPTIDTLCKMCKAFNITLSEFFYEGDNSDMSIFSAKYARLNEKDKVIIDYLLDRLN